MNREKLFYELQENGYIYDHTSTLSGYISRKKEFEIIPYIGRFGIGVKVLLPRFDSSRYIYCMYYILHCDVPGFEQVFCEFKNGNKEEYLIEGYNVGKYDITFDLLAGGKLVFKKSTLKNIITAGVKRICGLIYSDQ